MINSNSLAASAASTGGLSKSEKYLLRFAFLFITDDGNKFQTPVMNYSSSMFISEMAIEQQGKISLSSIKARGSIV